MLKKRCGQGISFLIGIINFISCGKPCEHSYTYIAPELMKYFNVYKPGNWWIYENTELTIRDSLYIANYHSYFRNMNTSCENPQVIDVWINSSFLSQNGTLSMSIENSSSLTSNANISTFNNQYSYFKVFIEYHNPEGFYLNSSASITAQIVDTTILGIFYSNVIVDEGRSFGFAENIGLLFTVTPQNDTLNLTNYYIL